jgi:hypothetical protein
MIASHFRRPAHAVNIEPGTWAFETEIDYCNPIQARVV